MSGKAFSPASDGETQLHMLLIVEDDEAIGDFLVETIKCETPYAVLLVTDATQALEAIKTVRPSLFILDYHLPGINGIELHDRLHAAQELEPVPTLMVSSHSPPLQALRQRHIDFLKKPFELTTLLTTIEKLMEGVKGS